MTKEVFRVFQVLLGIKNGSRVKRWRNKIYEILNINLKSIYLNKYKTISKFNLQPCFGYSIYNFFITFILMIFCRFPWRRLRGSYRKHSIVTPPLHHIFCVFFVQLADNHGRLALVSLTSVTSGHCTKKKKVEVSILPYCSYICTITSLCIIV